MKCAIEVSIEAATNVCIDLKKFSLVRETAGSYDGAKNR